MDRRNFLKLAVGVIGAPMVVRAESLMPIAIPKGMRRTDGGLLVQAFNEHHFNRPSELMDVMIVATDGISRYSFVIGVENVMVMAGDDILIDHRGESVRATVVSVTAELTSSGLPRRA